MDSDCLIKLTKGEAKEEVVRYIEVFIPRIVQKETVEEGKARGYSDPLEIEKNIEAGKIRVQTEHASCEIHRVAETLRLQGGEVDVYGLFQKGEFTVMASDDQKFIKKMEEIDVPCITPTALLIYIWRKGRIDTERAFQLLENLRPWVSDEEYVVSKLEIEKGR